MLSKYVTATRTTLCALEVASPGSDACTRRVRHPEAVQATAQRGPHRESVRTVLPCPATRKRPKAATIEDQGCRSRNSQGQPDLEAEKVLTSGNGIEALRRVSGGDEVTAMNGHSKPRPCVADRCIETLALAGYEEKWVRVQLDYAGLLNANASLRVHRVCAGNDPEDAP